MATPSGISAAAVRRLTSLGDLAHVELRWGLTEAAAGYSILCMSQFQPFYLLHDTGLADLPSRAIEKKIGTRANLIGGID